MSLVCAPTPMLPATATTYLSRVRLRGNIPASALRVLLTPTDDGAQTDAGHRLIWTLFGDHAERQRDFLWRAGENGTFFLLSERVPVDQHGLFDVEFCRPFAPALAVGERLEFLLRVNPTTRWYSDACPRGKRADVVMQAIHGVAKGSRTPARADALVPAIAAWLTAQGARTGFSLAAPVTSDMDDAWDAPSEWPISVESYRTVRVLRGVGRAPMTLGVADVTGQLVVDDVSAFLAAVARGFGRGRAFGFGLMMIRRS
jgi:CRISPR system Cascade subunit CasE